MNGFDRRRALQLLALAGATLSGPQARPAWAAPAAGEGLFRHGVASGDPDATSVVLWTRITTDDEEKPVSWRLAEDPDFSHVVAEGDARAGADADHTVKVVADGLTPGAHYYYRFIVGDEASPVGRTRTLPVGPLARLGIAVASCTNYPFGYFNAYDAIARDPRVDVVFHAGDYIYEYATDGWSGPQTKALGRESLPDKEIVTLADYRQRHAQYKSDAGAQAMHAAHPFVACWDDHEVANNPWKGGAQNHQPETEGDWSARRAAALRAYFEWMPIREPAPDPALDPGAARARYWRSYKFGDLASFVILETRHTGRDQEPPYPDWTRFSSMADRDAFYNKVIADPTRKMLAPEMAADVGKALKASVAAGEPWRIIGTASPLARLNIPDITALGIARDELSDGLKYLADHGRWNWPWYTDTWDGYPVARQAFYDLCGDAGARDLLALTGDTHQFWASALADDQGRPMGVELGTAGISSPSEYIDTGLDPEVGRRLDAIYAEHMPEVHWTDGLHNGYIRVELTPEQALATVIAVNTVLSPNYKTSILFRERITKSDESLRFAPA